MNQARAAEANKHRLDVARALLAKDGLVKHVQYQGKSILYVCLPALHEEFLKSHSVYIPSYTAFVKTLDHPRVLRDRPYSHRFHSQATKSAALAYKWYPDREFLPAADELADLLHLDESSGPAGLKPAAAGAPAGPLPPVVGAAVATATVHGGVQPPIAAAPQAPIPQQAPTALNPLFQTFPKGVGLTWGRRSRAALQMRQQLWEQKQQQQQLQQAVATSAGSSESPQQSEDAIVKEQQLLATMAESKDEAKQSAKEKPDKASGCIPPYMVLTEEQRQQLKEQRTIAGVLQQQDAGTTAAAAAAAGAGAAVAPVAGGAAADITAGMATAQVHQGSRDFANGAVSGARGISSGGLGGSSGGTSDKGSEGDAAVDGKAATSAAAAAGVAAAAAASDAATAAAAAVGEKEQCTPQQERSFAANSRTGSSNNLLAGQQQQQQLMPNHVAAAGCVIKQPQQQQQTSTRKRHSSQEPQKQQQQQQQELLERRKKQRVTPPLARAGGSNAAAVATLENCHQQQQQQQQGSKPSIQPLPLGMQVAHMAALQQQNWQRPQGQNHHHQQQQQRVACAAPMGSQQVMQQQLKQMLCVGSDFMHPMPHSSFISVGYQQHQQQQQLMAAETLHEAATKQLKQQRHPAQQSYNAPPQQQQYLPGHSMKPRVLPLPVAMQVGTKSEQQRQQLQIAFRQAWQQHQQRQQQHKSHHWQQRKPSSLKPRFADTNDVVRSTGRAEACGGSVKQQQAGGPTGQSDMLSGQLGVRTQGQPGMQLSGQPGIGYDHTGQAGAHVSGQPGVQLSGQPGVGYEHAGQAAAHMSGQPGVGYDHAGQAGGRVSGQPGGRYDQAGQAGGRVSGQPGGQSSGQAAEAAGKFSMKAVFSGRQMKRLQQLLKQQHDEDEGMAQQLEQPSTDRQQQQYQLQGFSTPLQQQQAFPTKASAFAQEEHEENHILGHAAQKNHTSLPLKRKPLETGVHLLGSTAAAVPAAAAAGGGGDIAACDHALLLPPPQRRKRVSSDAGLMSKPSRRVEYTLTPDESQDVTSLLAAVCVMVGAAGLQHLVAAIDQLLLPGSGATDVQRQGGRDQAANKQQQQGNAVDVGTRNAGVAAAAAGPTRPSTAAAANEKGGISRDLLSAVRWLAAKLGSAEQQQQQHLELVVPSLQQLCQKHRPCLLETASTLDANGLLSLTEQQLQAFLAGVLGVELQLCMQCLGIKAVQHGANELHARDLGVQQQQQELVVQQQQQQQVVVMDGNASDASAGVSAGNAPMQQQQQVVDGGANTGSSGGSARNALLQQQQQFAMALIAEYTAGRRVVCCRPKTLMMLTADRMMAAVAHEAKQQQGTGDLISPAAQAAAAASVAARLADRELQLAAAGLESGAGSSQQLPGGSTGANSSAAAAGNPKQLAGGSSAAAAVAAAGAEQCGNPSSSSSSSESNAGLHILNAFLLRSQFHSEVGAGLLSVDMPHRCAVAAAAAGTTSDLRVSSTATVVFAFSLQTQRGFEGVGHIQGLGDAERLNPAEPAPAAEPKPLVDKVLASWLCIGPNVVLWRKLVALLLQFQQQQQQEENGKETPSHAQQQEQYNLQQCYNKAQELLRSLQLQPDDIAHIQAQLKDCTTSTTHQQQHQERESAVVLLQQTPGRGVVLHPGWLHLQVSHAPNVTLWFDVLRACDAAAAALVQREMPWAQKPELQSIVHVGPLVLKTLQQWYAYCQQQQQQ